MRPRPPRKLRLPQSKMRLSCALQVRAEHAAPRACASLTARVRRAAQLPVDLDGFLIDAPAAEWLEFGLDKICWAGSLFNQAATPSRADASLKRCGLNSKDYVYLTWGPCIALPRKVLKLLQDTLKVRARELSARARACGGGGGERGGGARANSSRTAPPTSRRRRTRSWCRRRSWWSSRTRRCRGRSRCRAAGGDRL